MFDDIITTYSSEFWYFTEKQGVLSMILQVNI